MFEIKEGCRVVFTDDGAIVTGIVKKVTERLALVRVENHREYDYISILKDVLIPVVETGVGA